VPDGFDLMLGNGSDELISLLAMACDVPGASILAPLPGFVMYGMSAQLQGLKFVGVDLTPDFELDERAMLDAIATPAVHRLPGLPEQSHGQPVGRRGHRAHRRGRARGWWSWTRPTSRSPAAATSTDRLTRHDHVLLMRTLSKFGLAGVRIGYMIGPPRWSRRSTRCGRPTTSASSTARRRCSRWSTKTCSAAGRRAAARARRLLDRLAAMPQVKAWPSDANMILVRVPDAGRAFEGMKARGVLVKNVSRMHPLLANCLRLTVGTADENAQMLAALQASL
jgi:histidinol-phosphate aminotransferase